MNWIFFAILTIVLYGVHDIILKHLSDNTNAFWAAIVINISAAVGTFGYFWATSLRKPEEAALPTAGESALLVIAGVCLGLATVTFMKTFSTGGDFSVAVPLVYVGIILMSLLVGYTLFKEKITPIQMIGIFFSCLGMYCMIRKG